MKKAPVPEEQNVPFYAREGGLRFTCKPDCAACCKISGRVEIDAQEADRMATHLKIDEQSFRAQYTHSDKEQLLLREQPGGPCVLLGPDDRCRVYPVRPLQCRTYPFWDEVLANDFTWLLEKGFCPGIDAGRLYSPEEIVQICKGHRDANGYDI